MKKHVQIILIDKKIQDYSIIAHEINILIQA